MIKIIIPSLCDNEIRYIVDTLFTGILGIEYNLITKDEAPQIKLILPNNTVLNILSPFFSLIHKYGLLNPVLMPVNTTWYQGEFYTEGKLPVLYGAPTVIIKHQQIDCSFDIFGSSFFIISRLEELIVKTRDKHDRFPATASFAYKNGFLDRPVVDEYADMLFNMLKRLDSSISKNSKKGRIVVTCDVDWPFDPVRRSIIKTLRSTFTAIIKKRDLIKGLCILFTYARHKTRLPQKR